MDERFNSYHSLTFDIDIVVDIVIDIDIGINIEISRNRTA